MLDYKGYRGGYRTSDERRLDEKGIPMIAQVLVQCASGLFEVFVGEGEAGALIIPHDAGNPVTALRVDNLQGIDAACEGLSVAEGFAGLVGSPDAGKVAEGFDAVGDAALKEAVGLEVRVVTLNVAVRREENGVALARGFAISGRRVGADDTHAAIGEEERAEAVPIARLAGGAGDDVVERSHQVVDGIDVCRVFGGGPVRMRGDGGRRGFRRRCGRLRAGRDGESEDGDEGKRAHRHSPKGVRGMLAEALEPSHQAVRTILPMPPFSPLVWASAASESGSRRSKVNLSLPSRMASA